MSSGFYCTINNTSLYVLFKLFNLVDPASSHMLIYKAKLCMSKYKFLYNETANSSLKQLYSMQL